MYALGWTQHSKGSQNIRTMAMIQLLLGNIGVAGGGMNALRGHSNIQGLTDLGLMSNLIPGYLTLPVDKEQDRATYLSTRRIQAAAAGPDQLLAELSEVLHQLPEGDVRHGGDAENDFAYDWLPKLDVTYDILRAFELMYQGKMNGLLLPGLQPADVVPQQEEDHRRAVEAEDSWW